MMHTPDRTLHALFAAGLLTALSSAVLARPPVHTLETNTTDPAQTDEFTLSHSPWRFEFTPMAWLIGLDGDIGVRGHKGSISASFVDVVDDSDSLFAFTGRLEIAFRRFGVYLDGMYAEIGVNDVSGFAGFLDADVDTQQTILDFGAMYRLGQWSRPTEAGAEARATTLDLYAGGRYSGIDIKLTPAVQPARSDGKDWVDPVVGAKLVVPFSERWRVAVNGDVGGFGAASDFTWSTTALIGYDFHIFRLPASVLLGYRALGWDYSNGSGNQEFTWDVVEHGPLLGLSLRF